MFANDLEESRKKRGPKKTGPKKKKEKEEGMQMNDFRRDYKENADYHDWQALMTGSPFSECDPPTGSTSSQSSAQEAAAYQLSSELVGTSPRTPKKRVTWVDESLSGTQLEEVIEVQRYLKQRGSLGWWTERVWDNKAHSCFLIIIALLLSTSVFFVVYKLLF